MRLFTIGYEGRRIEEFIGVLMENRVDTLIDIRAVPHSRNRDYTKRNLESALRDRDIGYILKKELGSDKGIRNKVKSDGDYDYFFKEYEESLKDKTDIIAEIAVVAKEKRVCLLCYEADYNKCHRRSVAGAVATLAEGCEITHL